MLTSPVWRERNRQGLVLALFIIGLLSGGALAGGVLWVLSGLAHPLPAATRQVMIVAVAALGVLREMKLVSIPLPQNARQVPQSVLQRSLLSGGLQFGFELGTGVRTYVSSSAPYVVAAAILLTVSGSMLVPLLAGLGFGAGRALTSLARYWSRGGEHWDQQLDRNLKFISYAACVVILAVLGAMALQ